MRIPIPKPKRNTEVLRRRSKEPTLVKNMCEDSSPEDIPSRME
jgi:hypothetical protein